jgi:hypothetical protein
MPVFWPSISGFSIPTKAALPGALVRRIKRETELLKPTLEINQNQLQICLQMVRKPA